MTAIAASTWLVRRAKPHELAALADLERRAGARFDGIPALDDLPEVLAPYGALVEAETRGQVWVAVSDGTPIGFAYADLLDDAVHLEELDVLPDWGRRGIGQALVEAVVADARARGRTGVTLTTFREVPWNAPWYARLGFRILDLATLPPGLAALVDAEDARGLPKTLRVAMRRDV